MDFALALHAAATWYMIGVIWLIQVVHYPMLQFMELARFESSHVFHSRAITFVVLPAMLLELVLSAFIVWKCDPRNAPALAGFFLVVLIWLTTFLVLVPLHRRLQTEGFQPEVHVALCRWNWLRTLAWSARGAIVVVWLSPR